jgi:hypothetical protein
MFSLNNIWLFITLIIWILILYILGLSAISVEAAPQLINRSIINQTLLDDGALLSDVTAALAETQAQNPFYGISTAVPGTFARLLRKFYLQILSSTTTTATWTTPTSATPSIAARVGTPAASGSLFLALLYRAWLLGSWLSGYTGGK